MHLPDIFPPFLSDEVPKHHGVVACEGSMFKSKFANALTTMMIGSLGIAAAQNKLSVGYGAEAGHMDPLVAQDVRALLPEFVGHHPQRGVADPAARTGRAHRTGHRHGLDIRAAPAEYGHKVLRQAGWDGSTPVLVVCPINPFEWPVKASVGEVCGAHADRGIQRKPLPLGLLPQLRPGGGSRATSTI